MKKIPRKIVFMMWWHGIKLKPTRMMGNSGKSTWVVASSHPLYSIVWTWAIYWNHPRTWKRTKDFLRFGFSLSKQDLMIHQELKGRI